MDADVYLENNSNITVIKNGQIRLATYNTGIIVIGINSTESCDYAWKNARILSENLASCLFNISTEQSLYVPLLITFLS